MSPSFKVAARVAPPRARWPSSAVCTWRSRRYALRCEPAVVFEMREPRPTRAGWRRTQSRR
jgi:hypothetical protein